MGEIYINIGSPIVITIKSMFFFRCATCACGYEDLIIIELSDVFLSLYNI